MNKDAPIILLDDSANSAKQRHRNLSIAELELCVFGELELFHIGIMNCPATLADLVPMARALTTAIVQIIRRKVIRGGIAVPCRKGCTSCCHQMIFLSVPEVFRLIEETKMMPLGRRRHTTASCRDIANEIEDQLPSAKIDTIGYYRQLQGLLEWYFRQGIPCPFLCNEMCTIYQQRPIVCREHLMTGPASPCRIGRNSDTHKVDLPVSIPSVLTELSAEVECRNPEPVALPCIFGWYKRNVSRHTRTWPASFLVERFVKIALRSQRQMLTSQIGDLQVFEADS